MTEIQAPVAKSAVALGSGAGASVVSKATETVSFFPTDFAGWMAVCASTAACLYTGHLLGEWYWKKVFRPFLKRKGWVK
jgi:hypothetical protein